MGLTNEGRHYCISKQENIRRQYRRGGTSEALFALLQKRLQAEFAYECIMVQCGRSRVRAVRELRACFLTDSAGSRQRSYITNTSWENRWAHTCKI